MEFCNYKVGRRILRQYFFLKPAIAKSGLIKRKILAFLRTQKTLII